ncbi:hypothetical protein GCM10007881_26570 [Mesorhizobium huakuii]|nr:hypothetical protein GCM10007881_26570 [Mesorhizobium huakuii]
MDWKVERNVFHVPQSAHAEFDCGLGFRRIRDLEQKLRPTIEYLGCCRFFGHEVKLA